VFDGATTISTSEDSKSSIEDTDGSTISLTIFVLCSAEY
jgi:hypothetical protein